MVTGEASYLNPVMTPVAWVAGIWLTALDLHLPHRGVKTECNRNRQVTILRSDLCHKCAPKLLFIKPLKILESDNLALTTPVHDQKLKY